MRLVNWNIERRGPLKWQAASIVSEIDTLSPDLIVLTEAHAGSLDSLGGYTLSHRGYDHGRKADSERLVLMWSRSPWEEIPLSDELQVSGGALLGRTQIHGRLVHCLALCIPWHMSPDPSHRQDKIVPWAQHTHFLRLLRAEMAEVLRYSPLVIAGDFNRRMPRRWGPKAAYTLLEAVFARTEIITRGRLAPLDLNTIDHVAISGPLRVKSVRALSRFAADGRPRSDHFGVMADFDWT